jgi:hypothetical protein
MCLFTVIWALLIVLPAFLFTRSERSVLETLGKVGVFFVGAKVSMFSLGYFPSTLCWAKLLIFFHAFVGTHHDPSAEEYG